MKSLDKYYTLSITFVTAFFTLYCIFKYNVSVTFLGPKKAKRWENNKR